MAGKYIMVHSLLAESLVDAHCVEYDRGITHEPKLK